ncbi:nuclear transport factor 2 family protein [Thioclava sp. F36-6]|uniref:nuclear transport factor 2 family protein n=1 Tax=Thioclava sp. F36-6 TaxID=1915316 RepID=UPI001AEF53EC|nr:nuclear transport factor 2 family protein [Thioclava sp. F36-6]
MVLLIQTAVIGRFASSDIPGRGSFNGAKMTTKQLCIDYLKALNEGNLAEVRALFSDNAKVVSPLYGVLDAFDFYADLFKDTNRSETSLLNVFDTSEMSKSVALHFRYEWTLADGKLVSFECVDVFELNDARDRFEKLTIIYDTAPLRQDFDNLRRT